MSGYTNQSYGVLAIDINQQYLEETLGEDIIAALVKQIQEMEEKSAVVAVGKYQDLQADIEAMLQRVQG